MHREINDDIETCKACNVEFSSTTKVENHIAAVNKTIKYPYPTPP